MTADRIIHNAWPVNFNIAIASFEPHICGVRRLVDFSNAARKRVPIVFISSVGEVDNWIAAEPVPEEKVGNLALAGTGYGRLPAALSSMLLPSVREC